MNILTFNEASGRPSAEGAFRIEPHPENPKLVLVALAEGQGEDSGGARAARIAVDAAIEDARGKPADRLLHHPAAWREVLHRADDAVMADPDAGFASLVGFIAGEGVPAVGASCGDSEAVMVHEGATARLTDHQFRSPPVGSGDARFTPFRGSADSPWCMLAMTDSAWKQANWDAVEESECDLRGQQLIDALASRARASGNGRCPDDFTIVLLES